MLKYVPNTLTIIRIFLVPIILFFIIQNNFMLAIILLVISGMTDIADGFIARKFDLITDFGKLADPLADKLTQVSTLIAIVAKGIIPLWIVIIFLIKEVMMICGSAFLYGKKFVVSSKWYGKVTTVILDFDILFSMIIRQFELGEAFVTANNIIYIVCAIFSLIMYCKGFFFDGLLRKETEN